MGTGARSRPSIGRATASAAVVVAVALSVHAGCGSESPTDPEEPVELVGAYRLEIIPSSATACGFEGLSFPVEVTGRGLLPHPSVQLLLDGAEPSLLELELKDEDNQVEGGMGTTHVGVLANEGLRLWIRAIGTGTLTDAGGGRAEVVSGQLRGYLAVAQGDGEEGAGGLCTNAGHHFALRIR